MATYQYQNSAGQVREIQQPMNVHHPEAIMFREDGTWFEVAPTEHGSWVEVEPVKWDELPEIPRDQWPASDVVFVRVMGDVQINAHPCTGKYPYVSRSIRVGRDLAPDTDKRGNPVIYNREQDDRIAKATGFVKEA